MADHAHQFPSAVEFGKGVYNYDRTLKVSEGKLALAFKEGKVKKAPAKKAAAKKAAPKAKAKKK